MDIVRESALKVGSGRKFLAALGKTVTDCALAFRSDTLPTELFPPQSTWVKPRELKEQHCPVLSVCALFRINTQGS